MTFCFETVLNWNFYLCKNRLLDQGDKLWPYRVPNKTFRSLKSYPVMPNVYMHRKGTNYTQTRKQTLRLLDQLGRVGEKRTCCRYFLSLCVVWFHQDVNLSGPIILDWMQILLLPTIHTENSHSTIHTWVFTAHNSHPSDWTYTYSLKASSAIRLNFPFIT